jgi:protein-tyrosine-phosphatase
MFAALGDPHRLSIAKALGRGDVSPRDLAAGLAMPSNLMAHHVAVLQDAGVVDKRRSESDKRRVYLRLTEAGWAVVRPEPLVARRVLFVCTHNSARSQFAEALWRRHSPLPARSAGTDPAPAIHPLARRVARTRGLDLGAASPRRLTAKDPQGALVVTVCDRADDELDGVDHLHWSIPDPAAHGKVADFERAFAAITARIDHLADLTKESR